MRDTLKKLREAKGLTLRELSQELGYSHSYYHRIEQGEKNGSYAFWERVREYYGLDKGFVWRIMTECSTI